MPSIYTHYNFSCEVLKKLPKKIQTRIDTTYYHLFAQSFDNLMYYNFLSLKPGKKIRKLSTFAHQNKINAYFINIINYIKANNLQNNKQVVSYLYGSLTHYILDSTTHPFINYYSLTKNNKFKFKSYHPKNEIMIDAYFYESNTKKDFNKFKIYKNLIPKIKFNKEITQALDDVYYQTFSVKNIGKIYEKSYNQSYYIYKYLLYDPYGIKKFFYKLFDYITFFKENRYEYFAFHTKLDKTILNLNHETWYNPKDKKIKSTASFLDIYNAALIKATNLIKIADKIIINQENLEKLTNLLGDCSYASGLDWHDKRPNKYFKN